MQGTKRKERHSGTNPVAVHAHNARQLLPAHEQAYDSVSKTVQRFRIFVDMQRFAAGGARTPSLLYLAAPSGSDSVWFQSAIDAGQLPASTRLVAVNYGDVATTAATKNVVVKSHTTMEQVLKTTADTFSHVWLDLTCTELTAELLWRVGSVLDDSVGRDCVYINLSKRGRTFDTHLVVTGAVCDALAFKITHVEDYTGASKANAASQKRNMVFFVCSDVANAPRCQEAFDPNMEAVGGLVYVPYDHRRSPDTMERRSRGNTYDHHVGFVRAYRSSPPRFDVSLFDTCGRVKDAVETVLCDQDVFTATWKARLVAHRPRDKNGGRGASAATGEEAQAAPAREEKAAASEEETAAALVAKLDALIKKREAATKADAARQATSWWNAECKRLMKVGKEKPHVICEGLNEQKPAKLAEFEAAAATDVAKLHTARGRLVDARGRLVKVTEVARAALQGAGSS
jgi:hypothetical protein